MESWIGIFVNVSLITGTLFGILYKFSGIISRFEQRLLENSETHSRLEREIANVHERISKNTERIDQFFEAYSSLRADLANVKGFITKNRNGD